MRASIAAIAIGATLAACSSPCVRSQECPEGMRCIGGACFDRSSLPADECSSHAVCTFARELPVGFCGSESIMLYGDQSWSWRVCESLPGCQLEGCPAGEACVLEGACETAAATCARWYTRPCTCHFVEPGRAAPVDTPAIVLSPGERYAPSFLLYGADRAVAGGVFDLEVGGGLGVAGDELVAGPGPEETVVTASLRGAERPVTCSARLVSTGAAAGGTELVVTSAASGVPIAGGLVIADVDGDGSDDGGAAPTSATGLTSVSVAEAPAITVLAPGSESLSVLLPASPARVRVALAPAPAALAAPRLAGSFATTHADPATRASLYGSGLELIAASSSLSDLAGVADDAFVQPGAEQCASDADLGQGCASLPGLGIYAAVPPNVGVGAPVVALARPGVRFAWGLAMWNDSPPGAVFEWYFIARMTRDSSCICDFSGDCDPGCGCDVDCTNTACACDVTRTCDAGCECDADCPAVPDRLSLAALLWQQQGGLNFSSKVQGVLFDESEADVTIRAPYQRPLDQLSELPVPDFPLDPARAGVEILQQLIVMTGSNVPGAGFVPLGFAVGLACELGDTDPSSLPPFCPTGAATDRRVKSGFACVVEDPLVDACPSYIPTHPDPGRVILQYTPPHDGLEGWPEVMVAIALPDKSRMYADDHRVAGLIVHRAPIRDYDDAFESATYPSFPVLPATYVPRMYELHADPSFDVHWVVFGDDGADPTVPRWELFALADVDRTFIAPVPPPGIDDIFDGSRPIKFRHTGLRLLPGETLQSLAESGALTPGKLFDHVSAFATRRGVLQP